MLSSTSPLAPWSPPLFARLRLRRWRLGFRLSSLAFVFAVGALVFASLRLPSSLLKSLGRQKTLSLDLNEPWAFGQWPKVASPTPVTEMGLSCYLWILISTIPLDVPRKNAFVEADEGIAVIIHAQEPRHRNSIFPKDYGGSPAQLFRLLQNFVDWIKRKGRLQGKRCAM